MLEENNENISQPTDISANIFHIEPSLTSDEKIKLLSQCDKFSRENVIESLNDLIVSESNIKVLQLAVKLLAKYNDVSSLPVLVDLLLFKEQKFHNNFQNNCDILKIRCQIAKILGNLKNQQAVPSLLFILNNKDEDYTLRLSVAEALGKIGDEYAVTTLIDIVSNENEKSIYLRESAAKALGMLGDIRAIDPFIKILESKKGIIDKFTFLKEQVIESIGKIGYKNDKILKALSNSLMDEAPSVRLGAIEALSEINDERVIQLIIPLIRDEEEDVARSAIVALYNIEGCEYIKKLLEDNDLPGWCRDEIEMILEEENDEDDECEERK